MCVGLSWTVEQSRRELWTVELVSVSWTVLAVQERVLDCRAPKGDYLIPFWGDSSNKIVE